MRVFVAGASGALGVQLVPQLMSAGHEVVAMTRTESKQDGLRALGAQPVVADALDRDAVARVVGEAQPDVIVHQLTALSGRMGLRGRRKGAGPHVQVQGLQRGVRIPDPCRDACREGRPPPRVHQCLEPGRFPADDA